jgi:hypothetical protein
MLKGTSPTTSPISKEEKTIIGEHISIEGNIRGEENLIIEGAMKGKLEMEKHNFTVGSKGRVEGEIHAQNVSISGQLEPTSRGSLNWIGNPIGSPHLKESRLTRHSMDTIRNRLPSWPKSRRRSNSWQSPPLGFGTIQTLSPE